jgi:hypothetical protein
MKRGTQKAIDSEELFNGNVKQFSSGRHAADLRLKAEGCIELDQSSADLSATARIDKYLHTS